MKKKENLRRIIWRNLCWDNQFFSTKGQGCHVSFNFLSFKSKKKIGPQSEHQRESHIILQWNTVEMSLTPAQEILKERKSSRLLW